MWEGIQFLCLVFFCLSALTFNSKSLPQFALYSELVWLSIYVLVALSSTFIDSPELASTPFIILVLTAVEAVVVWILVTSSFKLYQV